MRQWIAKFTILVIVLLAAQTANGQVVVQTYIDKCSGEVKTVTTTYVSGTAIVAFYDQIRTFSAQEVQQGIAQIWINQKIMEYQNRSCPPNAVIVQTIQNTVTQAAQQASSAASSAANAAAAAAANVPPPPPTNTPPPASSSNSSSSSSNSSSTSENKTEQKTETKTEQKTEEKKEETKTENKEETKEDTKEENKEEKKEEKKKEEKKKVVNPPIVNANLATGISPEGRVNTMINMGVSKSSMMGDKSYGANLMVWDNLQQFNLAGNFTKILLNADYKPVMILSSSAGVGYLSGIWNSNVTNSVVLLGPNQIVGGCALTFAGTFVEGNTSIAQIATAFITKPFNFKKVTVSPMLAWSNLGALYMVQQKTVTEVTGYSYIAGSNFDLNISRRFKFNLGALIIGSTEPGTRPSYNITIGSRFAL
jgi:outer membrane biosynthesis protein TonB